MVVYFSNTAGSRHSLLALDTQTGCFTLKQRAKRVDEKLMARNDGLNSWARKNGVSSASAVFQSCYWFLIFHPAFSIASHYRGSNGMQRDECKIIYY